MSTARSILNMSFLQAREGCGTETLLARDVCLTWLQLTALEGHLFRLIYENSGSHQIRWEDTHRHGCLQFSEVAHQRAPTDFSLMTPLRVRERVFLFLTNSLVIRIKSTASSRISNPKFKFKCGEITHERSTEQT